MELPESGPERLEASGLRPAKRQRSYREEELASGVPADAKALREADDPCLLSLPDLIIWRILGYLDATALGGMNETCKFFRKTDQNGLTFSNRVAKDRLLRMVGPKLASRWRGYSWLQRLVIEETTTQFDMGQVVNSVGHAEPFKFKEVNGVTEITLDAPGPRMLVSDKSTADSPVLRWKLMLRGNNAAEFGVVPQETQDIHKALHKCLPSPTHNERATGFSSAITVGSLLPARLPMMKGSCVEVLVTPREVAVIVTNPADGAEMVWQNNSTVARPYTGPSELRLALTTNYRSPIKLAVTAWQRACFDVLHTLAPEQQAAYLAQSVRAPPVADRAPAPAGPGGMAAAMQPLIQAFIGGPGGGPPGQGALMVQQQFAQAAAQVAAAVEHAVAVGQEAAAAAGQAAAAAAAGQGAAPPPPAVGGGGVAAAPGEQAQGQPAAGGAPVAAPAAGPQAVQAVMAVPVMLVPVVPAQVAVAQVQAQAQAAEPPAGAGQGMA
ncbi:hypothetical protein HYH02_006783 [Chlamydomonas schloesseri]|uniref:F-box domain-containing protein n=1 Tax=Chlamydomonas schloesseri TaxID=2026947 RepID=A0A835WIH2_9CHLO|nr:hypothetical protein HYH02_006783 [Chlamydomonas schloesseri]|eukprot:KAG2448198.1 hypothetical protein HYH02_006783 [Chlamydomonas schloesseri]